MHEDGVTLDGCRSPSSWSGIKHIF